MFLTKDILSALQLKRLCDHRYNSCGRTLLDPIIQPFWNWIVLKLPLWLAPNLMTSVGLSINILSSLILIGYSPDGTKEAPRWTFAFAAVSLFFYQTLDGCDGKQARRTGTSSPLGELLDHGCDSLSTVFVALGVSITLQLGKYPSWMFFQCFMAITLFYIAHWQTYVTGTLRFGKFDVTEAQYTVMVIHIVSAIFGPSIWNIQIPSLYIETKLIPVFTGIIAASFAFYANFTYIFTGGVEKNGSSIAGTSILSPLIPLALVVVPAFVIYQKSRESLYQTHPCLYILAFGIVASKVTNKLVVAHMTKSEIEYLDSSLVGPGMLFLNQYFNDCVDEYIVLWICLVYVTLDLLNYSAVVCLQICSHLQISLFTIHPAHNNEDPETSNLISNELSYQHSLLEEVVSVDDAKLDEEIP